MEESKTSDAPVAAESGGDGFLVASRNEKNIPKMVFIVSVCGGVRCSAAAACLLCRGRFGRLPWFCGLCAF